MNIPKKLKIGAHWIKIDESQDLGDTLNGDYDSVKLRIRIDKKLPQTMKESTLLHEIMHVLNGTFDNDTLGHSLLDSLSEQLYQVLKDNHLLNES